MGLSVQFGMREPCVDGSVAMSTKLPTQQYFVQTPKDLTAVEGTTVDLPCQVGALAGDVQWSKDGFLLGKCSYFGGKMKDSCLMACHHIHHPLDHYYHDSIKMNWIENN
ncbi:hypothetical protein AVEN_74653-1 [Araneus ventricosus]|uniref:Ig-like domain-containing protein n=1 Tax=Araneus ventricosus TaxID=182803 RepID=A0A4Y2F0R8_ARAVE|nr:hypothetical protein AVEN_74653-1 [Araneus ventricosus]